MLEYSCLMQRTHTEWLSSAYRWWGIACPEIVQLSGVVWRVKSRGPKTQPWGTPKERSALEDRQSPSLILRHLPVRYDLNQSSAFPETLNQSSSLLKRIVWSMVLKAAERSSKVTAVTLPASIHARTFYSFFNFFKRISLGVLRRAVSVQWNFLYADC